MKKKINFNFKVKKSSKGTIVIEGLANANTVDRARERILPEAWDLENYKKNPIVLFDHGHDPTFGYMPIGKALEVSAKENGLYTKIELSSSKTEKIMAIRDLVEEGILKTFSVGFDAKDTKKSADGETMEITKAELIETSIVPIPMNQDSTFSLSSKRKAYWPTPLAKRWYDAYMDRLELHNKKAWMALAVNRRLYDLIESGEVRSKSSALNQIAEEADIELNMVKAIISGQRKHVPDQIVKAFADVLGVDFKTLDALNNGNCQLLDQIMGGKFNEEIEVGRKSDDKDDVKKVKAAEGKICCIAVSSERAESLEAAAEMVSAAGYAVDMAEEREGEYVFWQVSKEDAGESDDLVSLQLGDGVTAYLVVEDEEEGEGAPLEEPKPEEEMADEVDEEKSADEDKKEDEEMKALSDEEIEAAKEAYSTFQAERDATNEGKEGNPAAWVADEAAWDKAKEMARAAGASDIYAFAVWAYLNVLGGGKKNYDTGEIKNVAGGDDNPYIKAAENQIAMLGAILNELKNMGAGIKGLADLTLAVSKVTAKADEEMVEDEESKDDVDAKSLDLLLNYQADLDMRLKKLKV